MLYRIEKKVSKLFRAYRLYNVTKIKNNKKNPMVSKLFRAYRLYNSETHTETRQDPPGFKALSSLQVI